MSSPIEVRRLDADELSLIESLQVHARPLLRFYKPAEHRQWLNKALRDVKDGQRVALGAFLDSNNSPGLVGSAILTRATRQAYVELKNFIVSTTTLPAGVSAPAVHEQFLLGIERFCAARGFGSIETEVPAELTPDISFFLQKSYRVSDIRTSRYRNQDHHYVLEKALQRLYPGDPFDGLTVSRWLIYEYFGFARELGELSTTASGGEPIAKNAFLFPITQQREGLTSISLTGMCVFEHEDSPISAPQLTQLARSSYDLKILVAARSGAQYLASEVPPGVRIIDRPALVGALGKDSTASLLQVRREDIRGLLLVVGSSTQARLLTHRKPFHHVAGGGLGHVLNISSAADDGRLFAVFCSERITSNGSIELSIWGYSKIEDFNMIPQNSINEALKASGSERLAPGDLQYYSNNEFAANYNEAHQIAFMKLRPVVELGEAIDVFDETRISPEIISYLKAHEEFGIVSCYLDVKTVLEITSADRREGTPSSPVPLLPQQENAMLETIIAAIQTVGSLSGASAATAGQIKKLVGALTKSAEPALEEGPMAKLVEATEVRLAQLVSEFRATSVAGNYTTIERDKYIALISSQASKLLKASSSIKGQIPQYEQLVAFFDEQGRIT